MRFGIKISQRRSSKKGELSSNFAPGIFSSDFLLMASLTKIWAGSLLNDARLYYFAFVFSSKCLWHNLFCSLKRECYYLVDNTVLKEIHYCLLL